MARKWGWIAVLSLVAVVLVALPSAAGAVPGDLDPSFGTGGKVVTDLGGFERGFALLVQPNGKLVAGGMNEDDFLLVRYLPDGSPDPVFDQDGIVTTDFDRGPMHNDIVSGLAFRPGQLVAAGTAAAGLPSTTGTSAFAVARYRLDGSLDPTFDGDGKALYDFGGLSAGAEDVAIQPDGKIVVAGGVDAGTPDFDADFALARFNVDGSLDPTFGDAGQVITEFGSNGDWAFAVAVQGDGRIVAVGRTGENPADFAIARYNTDGTLDQSFDGDGKQTIDFGGTSFTFDVAIQSDGKILVAGAAGPGADVEFDFGLARLNLDGSLDTEGLDPRMDAPFGTGGKVITDFAGGDDRATSIAIEPGGKILVAGLATPIPGQGSDFGLARYHVNGSLDQDFGAGGKVTTSFTPAEDRAWGVVVQRDSNIVLAGESSGGSLNFALARYLVRGCCFSDGQPPGGPELPGPLP